MHELASDWLSIRDPIVSLVKNSEQRAYFGAKLVGEAEICREGSFIKNNGDNVKACETEYHLPMVQGSFFVIFVET